jgi:archaemetzincin
VVMRVGILPVGEIDESVLLRVEHDLPLVFPKTACRVVDERSPLPEKAFDEKRNQYSSNFILAKVQAYAARQKEINRVLGIADVDIFVPELNFVFGEAANPGIAALISLWRLKPEFYGSPPEKGVLAERSVKEAVHEIGHTLGLSHCPRSFCVMHFSNSVFDTDRKKSLFCDDCYLQVSLAIDSLK